MIRCADLEMILGSLHSCQEVSGGARVCTHCLYPSFEPVVLSISRLGDGFRVDDDGGACREAWLHGRDENSITRLIAKEAAKLQTKFKDGAIYGVASTKDWLPSVVLAVANASSIAAYAALNSTNQTTDTDLKAEISRSLEITLPTFNVKKGFPIRGKSGKEYDFDFGVFGNTSTILLINAVTPHPASIASKYLAFSDAVEIIGSLEFSSPTERRYKRFAVYDRPLASDDSTLMRQVADLVPISSLGAGALRAMSAQSMAQH